MEYDDDELGTFSDAPSRGWRGRIATEDPYFALGGDECAAGHAEETEQSEEPALVQLPQDASRPVAEPAYALPETPLRLVKELNITTTQLRKQIVIKSETGGDCSRQEELKRDLLRFESNFSKSHAGVKPSSSDIPSAVKQMYAERKRLKAKSIDERSTQTDAPQAAAELINQVERVTSELKEEIQPMYEELHKWRTGQLLAITTIDADTGASETAVIAGGTSQMATASSMTGKKRERDDEAAQPTSGLSQLIKVKDEKAGLQEDMRDADEANNHYVVFIEQQKDVIEKLKAQIRELGENS